MAVNFPSHIDLVTCDRKKFSTYLLLRRRIYENLDPAAIPCRWFIASTMILRPRLLRRQMSLLRERSPRRGVTPDRVMHRGTCSISHGSPAWDERDGRWEGQGVWIRAYSSYELADLQLEQTYGGWAQPGSKSGSIRAMTAPRTETSISERNAAMC